MQTIYPVIGKQTELPFYLTGIGEADPEYHVKRENGLVSHQFLFTESGRGVLHIGGSTYTLTAGSMIYLAPGVAHEYYPEKGGWKTAWLVFRGEHASEQLERLGFGSFIVRENAVTDRCRRIFDRLGTAAADPMGGEHCSVLLYEFIFAARSALLGPETSRGSEGIIAPAVELINTSYSRDLTLDELAERSGVSLQHFCRVFRSRFGMRPMEYLARTRVSAAKLLLRDRRLRISDIARLVGYRDPNYFGIVFKKYEGVSPGEFRRSEDASMFKF